MNLKILKDRGVAHKAQLNLVYGSMSSPVVKPRSWRSYLNSLSSRYNQWLGQGYKNDDGEADATEMMQQRYPGNYKLVEKYNPARGVFELDIQFENPKEEMLWRIKWEE